MVLLKLHPATRLHPGTTRRVAVNGASVVSSYKHGSSHDADQAAKTPGGEPVALEGTVAQMWRAFWKRVIERRYLVTKVHQVATDTKTLDGTALTRRPT